MLDMVSDPSAKRIVKEILWPPAGELPLKVTFDIWVMAPLATKPGIVP